MRTIKFLVFAVAMTIASSASAQFAGSGSGKSGSGFSSSSAQLDPKAHFTAEVRIGSVASTGGFGINLGGQKDIAALGSFTLAWDFVNFEYAAPFNSPADLDLLALKTGLRLFTPSFANDKVRFYTNLAMGYSCVLSKGYGFGGFDEDDLDDLYDYYYSYYTRASGPDFDDSMSANHGFGLTFGIGLQYNKKVHVGYSLQYETAFKSKTHFGTIGYTF